MVNVATFSNTAKTWRYHYKLGAMCLQYVCHLKKLLWLWQKMCNNSGTWLKPHLFHNTRRTLMLCCSDNMSHNARQTFLPCEMETKAFPSDWEYFDRSKAKTRLLQSFDSISALQQRWDGFSNQLTTGGISNLLRKETQLRSTRHNKRKHGVLHTSAWACAWYVVSSSCHVFQEPTYPNQHFSSG